MLKTKEEIAIMREGGKKLARIMEEVKKEATPGVTTLFLNDLAEKLIEKEEGKPSFKGYKGFPASLCTSINEEIVHGVPSERLLKEGDILSLDLGLFYRGFHTDMAITIPIGSVDLELKRLIREAKKSLKRGIKKAKKGNTFGDIGNTIERHVHKSGFSVVSGLCGHGIGREIHEDPQVLNEGKRRKGLSIEEGMVFCIEPMLSMGSKYIEEKEDGIIIKTADNSFSAHFEHTIAVTGKGTEVLTQI